MHESLEWVKSNNADIIHVSKLDGLQIYHLIFLTLLKLNVVHKLLFNKEIDQKF